jgi:hypothetical protein
MSNKIYLSIGLILFILMPLSVIKAIWVSTVGRLISNVEGLLSNNSEDQGSLLC